MKIKNRQLDALASRLFYVLFTMAALCCIFVIIFAVKGPKKDIFKAPKSTYDIDISSSYVTLDKTADYGQNYIDSIIFLGDYTIEGMLDTKVLSGGKSSHQVWSGESGDIALDANTKSISVLFADSDEIVKIQDALERRSPKYLIITLGISNGVPYCDKDRFCSYYQALIDVIKEASPSTNIILQSILPVSKKAERKNPAIANDRIDIANEWVVELCMKNDLNFLYTAEILKDEKGRLNSEYVASDGISINEEGYKKILRYIRTHGYN